MTTKLLKICFTSLYAYHLFNPENKSRFGGAELQLYLMARELAKDKNFEVHFVVGDFGQTDTETREGVALHKVFNPKGGNKIVKAALAFFGLLRMLLKLGADIHIQKAAGFESFVVALYTKLANKKLIYMIGHNPAAARQDNYGMSILRWRVFKLLLAWADLIVAQHPDQQAALKRIFGKDSIIRYAAQEIPTSGGFQDKTDILWVGRCDAWKRPEILLALAEKNPQQRFVMACPMAKNADYFKEIKARAERLSNVEFLEYVPHERITEYFKKAKLFVCTSVSEGFPNVFVEAAKTATPILSLAVNPSKMLDANGIGVFAAGDEQKLATIFQELAADSPRLERMSEKAYEYALKYHDLNKIAAEDRRMILRLAGRE